MTHGTHENRKTHGVLLFPFAPNEAWTYILVEAGQRRPGRRFQPSLPGASLVFRRLEKRLANARAKRRSVSVPTCFFLGGVKKGAVLKKKN